MAGKRKGTEETVTKDSAADLIPRRTKKVHYDEEVYKAEPGRLETKDGVGNKRKRPIPKEQKKRKKPKTGDERKLEAGLRGPKEQTKRKKPRVDEEANSENGLDGDDDILVSDTAATTSLTRRDDRDKEEVDRASTSEKDESNEDEPMDYAEETTVDTVSDSSLPTSMLKPEGYNTQHGYSTNTRSVERNITTQHGMKTHVKRGRAAYDEADTTASLKMPDDIRMTEREKPYSSRSNSKLNRSSVRASYIDYDPKIRQRHSQQNWHDSAKLNEESTFSPQKNTNKAYTSSSYTRKKHRAERTTSPSRKNKAPSSHSYTKSCGYLVVLSFFAVALITFILKMNLGTDIGSWFSSGCGKRKRYDRFDVLMQEQDIVRQQYPTLNESIFSIIAGASFDHVDEHRKLVRPVVLLLVGKQEGKTNVNDVAASVANMYANVFSLTPHERGVVGIIGTYLETSSSDEARREVHSHIEEGFRDCANVVLITDLDKVPPCSAILFHAYCDNDDAPYKDAVFIFTMTLQTELAEDVQPTDVEKVIQAQLDKGWSRCPEEFSPAKLVAMHSRVANNIVVI